MCSSSLHFGFAETAFWYSRKGGPNHKPGLAVISIDICRMQRSQQLRSDKVSKYPQDSLGSKVVCTYMQCAYIKEYWSVAR